MMLIRADARRLPLRDGCVQTVVTSPPYWGLRDYGVDGQIGLEADLDAYVGEIVGVFREVHRVLRDDGTAWVNLGDGYDAGTRAMRSPSTKADSHGYWTNPLISLRTSTDLGPKQMLAIPWRVALALQADGWLLRCDIVWHKSNPMPESVTDRPTKAHEYLFLLAKSERYYYDAAAIKEPVTGTSHGRGDGVGRKSRVVNNNLESGARPRQNVSFSAAVSGLVDERNRRSVWTIPTEAYNGAHFATFPEALVKPCILAGTSQHGNCAACGAPWKRLIEQPDFTEAPKRQSFKGAGVPDERGYKTSAGQAWQDWRREHPDVDRGWGATCRCGTNATRPPIVLDPFIGSGTVGAVAERLGRRWVGTDLTYQHLSKERTAQRGIRFDEESA